MAVNFPDSPSNNQIFTSGTRSWKYDGVKGIWKTVVSTTTKNLAALDESIIPSSNVTYDLGSASNSFRDLYLSGNSIFLGAGEITSSANGAITLPAGSLVGNTALGSSGVTTGKAIAMAIVFGG